MPRHHRGISLDRGPVDPAQPYLEHEDVTASLEYAAAIVNQREVPIARPA